MKAMILAAGLGTRLRPLTNDRPKALVELNGRTLLEITIERLKSFGIREMIVNVHHFADLVVSYLKANADFGIRIEVSREDDLLLDTGGGLKKAAWFFGGDEPFLLHNVDILSDIPLLQMGQMHRASKALATLAVQKRETSRYLLFDEHMLLCGRRLLKENCEEIARSAGHFEPLAFSGIHIISPRLLPKIHEHGAFSIINVYLRLVSQGESINGFRADDYYWRDLGRLSDLEEASQDLRSGKTT
jgi:NDP-sugar pyrophosphorylase family protein